MIAVVKVSGYVYIEFDGDEEELEEKLCDINYGELQQVETEVAEVHY